jgi:hypothetical protein
MPLTTRLLAMQADVPATPLLREILRALLHHYRSDLHDIDLDDRMAIYESRAQLYLLFLAQRQQTFACIERTLRQWLLRHRIDNAVISKTINVLHLDHACCPREGKAHILQQQFNFDADSAARKLLSMELPTTDDFVLQQQVLVIEQPGGIGEVLKSPDGGSWIKGNIVASRGADAIASRAVP